MLPAPARRCCRRGVAAFSAPFLGSRKLCNHPRRRPMQKYRACLRVIIGASRLVRYPPSIELRHQIGWVGVLALEPVAPPCFQSGTRGNNMTRTPATKRGSSHDCVFWGLCILGLCILGVVYSGGCDRQKVQRRRCTDATMSAPGALARHFRGDVSANHMPATALRKHSPPNTMAF